MAQLGTPEKVIYTARNLLTGLTDIVAYIMKPDNSIVGPFALTEIANVNFTGLYTFDFITDVNNDEYGVYTGKIVSPTEDITVPFKLSYMPLDILQLNEIQDNIKESLALLRDVDIEVEMDDLTDEITIEMDG